MIRYPLHVLRLRSFQLAKWVHDYEVNDGT